MTSLYQNLLAHLLHYGANDDVQFWIVINYVAEALDIKSNKMTFAADDRLWEGVSELVTLMLQNGFVASDHAHRGIENWDEQNPAQVLSKIRNRWVEYKGQFPDCGFIVWFHKAKS